MRHFSLPLNELPPCSFHEARASRVGGKDLSDACPVTSRISPVMGPRSRSWRSTRAARRLLCAEAPGHGLVGDLGAQLEVQTAERRRVGLLPAPGPVAVGEARREAAGGHDADARRSRRGPGSAARGAQGSEPRSSSSSRRAPRRCRHTKASKRCSATAGAWLMGPSPTGASTRRPSATPWWRIAHLSGRRSSPSTPRAVGEDRSGRMNVHGGDSRRHRYPGDSNIPYGISEMVIYDPAVPAVLTRRGRGSQVLRRHRQYKECSARQELRAVARHYGGSYVLAPDRKSPLGDASDQHIWDRGTLQSARWGHRHVWSRRVRPRATKQRQWCPSRSSRLRACA